MPRTKTTAIDDLDDRLLQLLDRDPQYTNRRLGELTNVTEVTVANRIRRMSDAGIARVVGSHDVRDEDVLRFCAYISVVGRDRAEVGRELARFDECRSVSLVAGPCDIVGTFTVSDTVRLREVIERGIPGIVGVDAVECDLCLDLIGYRDTWAKLV